MPKSQSPVKATSNSHPIHPKKPKPKVKVGPDGKTKYQRFREKHRARINAANAARMRERRMTQSINNVCALIKAAKTPLAPPPRLYHSPITRIEASITNSRENTMPSESIISPKLVKEFDTLKKRFDRWERDSRPVTLRIYELHSIRRGWLGASPFMDSELEEVMYNHHKAAKQIFTRLQGMIRKLSFEVSGHSDRWETAMDMFVTIVTNITLTNNIIDGYKEPIPSDELPPSSPPSDWEPPADWRYGYEKYRKSVD